MSLDEVLEKYNTVKDSIETAIQKTDEVVLCGEEENNELSFIRGQLDEMNERFKSEIEELEKNSEWNRFCISFFGETNAGKSTIIDALRIIYDEESRRNEIIRQKQELEENLKNEKEMYKQLEDTLEQCKVFFDSKKKLRQRNVRIVCFAMIIGLIALIIGIYIWI